MRFPQVSSNTVVVTGPISTGSCVNRTPRLRRRANSRWTSSTANDAYGIPSLTSAALNGLNAGCLEHSEVLRDRLPRRAEPILVRQARADLKQGLPIPFGQLIEDLSPRWIRQGLEDVIQRGEYMQVTTCMSTCTPSPLAGEGL